MDALEQRLEALDRANDVRTKRAKLKQELKAKTLDPVELLLDPPPEIKTAKIFDFLTWIPNVGKKRAKVLLQRVQMGPVPSTQIAALTERQRVSIASFLERRKPDER